MAERPSKSAQHDRQAVLEAASGPHWLTGRREYETTTLSLRMLADRHGFLSHNSICRRRDNEGWIRAASATIPSAVSAMARVAQRSEIPDSSPGDKGEPGAPAPLHSSVYAPDRPPEPAPEAIITESKVEAQMRRMHESLAAADQLAEVSRLIARAIKGYIQAETGQDRDEWGAVLKLSGGTLSQAMYHFVKRRIHRAERLSVPPASVRWPRD